jgi:hypothetical protein
MHCSWKLRGWWVENMGEVMARGGCHHTGWAKVVSDHSLGQIILGDSITGGDLVSIAHGGGIVAVLGEILAEACILVSDGILHSMSISDQVSRAGTRSETHLVDLRKKEESQESTEDAQRAGDEERILALANLVGGILLDNWQNVGAHEGADLANGGSIRVVLTTNGSGTTLGGTQTQVITGAKLAESEEDAITSQKRQNRNFTG